MIVNVHVDSRRVRLEGEKSRSMSQEVRLLKLGGWRLKPRLPFDQEWSPRKVSGPENYQACGRSFPLRLCAPSFLSPRKLKEEGH